MTDNPQTETVHACPPDGSGLTPCCGRTPFELPLTDRISSEAPITCPAASVPAAAPTDWIDGHPQLEAIAASVWERCGRSDSGGCVEDDPRNIAAAVLAAAPSAPAERYGQVRRRWDLLAGADTEQAGQPADRPASTAPLAAGLPLVQGRCPACGAAGLFLGSGGYVTCSSADCPEPDAATTVLEQYANEAHAPEHAWKVESPRRDNWASWGATYDERDWAQERYESAIEHAPSRPFRLVRATTTHTVEAEHTPAAVSQPGKEA